MHDLPQMTHLEVGKSGRRNLATRSWKLDPSNCIIVYCPIVQFRQLELLNRQKLRVARLRRPDSQMRHLW